MCVYRRKGTERPSSTVPVGYACFESKPKYYRVELGILKGRHERGRPGQKLNWRRPTHRTMVWKIDKVSRQLQQVALLPMLQLNPNWFSSNWIQYGQSQEKCNIFFWRSIQQPTEELQPILPEELHLGLGNAFSEDGGRSDSSRKFQGNDNRGYTL